MRNVYRLENESGWGPYRTQHDEKWDLCSDHSGSSHPVVCDDIEDFGEDYFCGFQSLKKLREWFDNGWLNRLRLQGFNVVRYKTKFVLQGESGRQIAFKKYQSTRVGEVNWDKVIV